MPDQFKGPIQDIRFVQLVDGRRIMQINRGTTYRWETPPTVLVQTLSDEEKSEIAQSLGPATLYGDR